MGRIQDLNLDTTLTDDDLVLGSSYIPPSGANAATYVTRKIQLSSLKTYMSNAIAVAALADNSVTAGHLDVSGNGTAGTVLTSDGDGSFSWTTKTANVNTQNVFTSSFVTDGTSGRVLLRLTKSGASDGTQDIQYNEGANVTLTRTGANAMTIASSHPSVSAASTSNNSGRTYIQDITLDSFGHITGLATATETVVQLTEEEVEDYVGGMLGGTETGITVTYQDATGDIDFVVDDSDFALTGDVTASATQTAKGNVSLATTIAADAVHATMLNDDVISGQTELTSGNVVDADELMISDGGTLKKVGVDSLKTYIYADTESVQDIVGAMFSSNTETNITATYQDGDGTIDLVATGTTYAISAVDGDNVDEEKIRLTDGDGNTDDVVLEAGNGLSIARSSDKITFTNSITNTQNSYSFAWIADSDDVNLRATVTGASSGTEDQKIVAGSNISISVDSASQITLSSTDTNTTYTAFAGSTSPGTAALVPARDSGGTTNKYLREDGDWVVPPNTDTNSNTTYTVSAEDGDNSDEEKIRLTGSDGSTDDIVLEAGTGLSIARSSDKITFTNTITDSNTWRPVAVDTDGDGSANNTLGASETLLLSEGSNISLSESGGVVTIASTDTNTTYNAMTNSTLGLGKLRYTRGGTPAAESQTTTANRTYGVTDNSSEQLVVNVPWTDTNTNQLTTFTIRDDDDDAKVVAQDKFIKFVAATGALGTNWSGSGTTGDPWVMTITSPDTDTNTTYSAATSSALGLMKLEDDTEQSVAANTVSSTAGRTYGIQFNSSDQAVVNVPWTDTNTQIATALSWVDSSDDIILRNTSSGASSGTADIKIVAGTNITLTHTDANNFTIASTDTNTTYSAATASALGLMKLASDTEQSVAAETVSATANRTYGVQFNSSDQAVVNVPWTDTNTNLLSGGTVTGDVTFNSETFTIHSPDSTDPLVILKNTNSDANSARLQFVKDKNAAGADGDDIGIIEFVGDDADQVQTTFAKMLAEVGEADNTDEAGKLSLQVAASDGTTTGLENGLVLTGHKTSDYVDVALGHGTSSTVTIAGNLQVSGTTTTVNSTTVNLNDHNIVLDSNNSTSAVVDGAGITLEGGTGSDATFTYNTTGPKFELMLGADHEDLKVDGLIAASLDISGNAEIDGNISVDGTANLDDVDIDGTVQIDGTVTVGVNDTGYDVKFFGATASKYMLWDASEDTLYLTGELDAGSLDISGDADIDGTLEAATLTVGGSNILTGGIVTSLGTISQDTVTFTSGNASDPLVTIKNTANDATPSRLTFLKDRAAAGQDNDKISEIRFTSKDDGNNSTDYALLTTSINDASNLMESGKVELAVSIGDCSNQYLRNGLVLTGGSANDIVNVTLGYGGGTTTIDGSLTMGSTAFVNNSGVIQVATQGTIDHDSLANFVAAEHYRWDQDISGTAVIHASNYTNTTYSAMGSSNNYAAGLVLAGAETHGGAFLRKDGSWQVPPDTTTNTQNTTTLSFVDSSDDIILRNTTGGAGSGDQDIKFVAGSNITLNHTDVNNIEIVATDTNTTYTAYAGSETPGTAALVPARDSGGSTDKYLREDGDWVIPPDTNTTYSKATNLAYGLVKLHDATAATVSPESVTTTANRSYAVQLDSNGKMSVNVPWSDTDTDTNTNQLTTFQVEDGDGDEVTISQGKEWKFVEGTGIDINWTNTSNGTDADPYDLTFTVDLEGTELKSTGETGGTKFLREDGDGTCSWQTVSVDTATNATHVYVADNESTNEYNAITFVEGASKNSSGNVGLESDGDFTYNPSLSRVTVAAAGEFCVGNTTYKDDEITSAGVNYKINADGDIYLDADAGDIIFADGGTDIARLTNSSSDFVIESVVQDKDIIFKGDDGGSTITALSIDMSLAGRATFKDDVIAYGSPSDISYKENIKPINNALDKVSKLKGVTFDWKPSDSILEIKEDIGFIAQDVQKVLPELVRKNGDDKLSLRDKGIVPVLVEAIKELKAEVEELKQKCNGCTC